MGAGKTWRGNEGREERRSRREGGRRKWKGWTLLVFETVLHMFHPVGPGTGGTKSAISDCFFNCVITNTVKLIRCVVAFDTRKLLRRHLRVCYNFMALLSEPYRKLKF